MAPFDGRLGLLAQLNIDDVHRIFGVGGIELAVRGLDVVDDPLHVGLNQDALALAGLIGLLVTTFAFLGVNMFLSGLHSYGTL